MNDDSELNLLTAATNSLDEVAVVTSQPWNPELVMELTYSILGFTLVTLLLCTVLLWKKSATSIGILRLFGIISIVGLSAVLLITGYNKDQLTPIVGLFGAIAGYLLGKDSSNDGQSSE
jgi:uncharacterized YccA/Bax inhibitor family protein